MLLFIELVYFNDLTHRVHDTEDTVYIIVVIAVTLKVGSTFLGINSKKIRKGNVFSSADAKLTGDITLSSTH